MLTSIIGWVVFGLIAGFLARMIHPGDDRMGLLGTMLLGIIGSLVGGGIATMLRFGTTPYDPAGWIMSILGAVVLLWLGSMVGSPRRTTV